MIFLFILISILGAIFIYILENKRIKNVSIGLKILSILTFPLFLICQLVIDIHAVFQKNVKWDTIPHKGKNK